MHERYLEKRYNVLFCATTAYDPSPCRDVVAMHNDIDFPFA